jgi:hypothetical protein
VPRTISVLSIQIMMERLQAITCDLDHPNQSPHVFVGRPPV